MIYLWATFLFQPIVTISADDKDDTANGPRFIFSLPPEIIHNPNFTVRDNRGSYQGSCVFREVEMENKWLLYCRAQVFPPNLNNAFLLKNKQEIITPPLF